jgi:hypothetical protein
MSFPLAQDIGYDPSLYTIRFGASAALRHNFVSHGEPAPWFGFLRPLTFVADAHTQISLRYELNTASPFAEPELMLVAADGHHYTAALPSGNGQHTVTLTGVQLHISGETPIVLIILRGRLQRPPDRTESQWTLQQFVLEAGRIPEVALVTPKLNAMVDGSQVAAISVPLEGTLKIERTSARFPAGITVSDSTGAHVSDRVLAAGELSAELQLNPHAAPGLWKAVVTQGNARTAFQFLVLDKIPAHPRLLLSLSRLDELQTQARYTDLRKQIHDHAVSLADKLAYNPDAGTNIDLMPSGPGIQPTEPGQLRPYMELVESYADAIVYNALDYRLNGNTSALAAARKSLATMVQWQAWVPPRFRSHGLYTYYEVGVIAQRVALGYDLIADELSGQEKENTASAFWKFVIHPAVQEYFSYNRDPIAASNWMANSVGGAIEAAVAVAGDTPGWRQREAPALAELEFAYEELLQGLFPNDGSEAEPYGYENFAMQGMSWGMSSLNSLGIHPTGSQRMVNGFWWPYYVTVRAGLQLDTGDFNGHLTGLPGFAWGAAFSSIPELRALYDTGTHLDLTQPAETGQNGHLLEERLGPIDLVCCSGPPQSFTPPPPSRVFPTRGSAALRSGWDKESVLISLRVGPWFNHQHADEGSFQVAAFGTELIGEAGYANYYTDPHYPDYFTQAAGHNTLLVDHNSFSQTAIAGRFWRGFEYPHFTAELLSPGIDYLSADLTSAYDGVLANYQREFFFLKPGILIVRDQVRSPAKHTFSWLLHSPPASTIAHDGHTATIQAKSAGVAILALGDNAIWKTAQTPIQSTLFTDLDHQHLQPREKFVLDSSPTTATQFLVGMEFERGNVDASALQPWATATGTGFVAQSSAFPARILFRSGPGKLAVGTASTDGSILAVSGAPASQSWLAIGATEIDGGGAALLHSSLPAEFALEQTASGLNVAVQTSAATTLRLYSRVRPSAVIVDNAAVAVTYEQHNVTVALPSAGEHHVSVQ